MNITMNTLHQALSNYFKKEIVGADTSTVKLHGGTVGNVNLITGTAETVDGQGCHTRSY